MQNSSLKKLFLTSINYLTLDESRNVTLTVIYWECHKTVLQNKNLSLKDNTL